MKVIHLKAENVKRLIAIDITPNDSVNVIAGRNGHGKSSVLDAIMYAIGGADVLPSEPIRKGETDAKIVVDLGDYTVTRKFKRELITDMRCEEHPSEDWPHGECAGPGMPGPKRFGPTNSSLSVTTKDGAKYASPQALLDKLFNTLTFDPLEFAHSKRQAEILRGLVHIDTTAVDNAHKAAFDRRTELRRDLKTVTAQKAGLTKHPDVPTDETSIVDVLKDLEAAEALKRAAETANATVITATTALATVGTMIVGTENQIIALEREMKSAQAQLENLTNTRSERQTALESAFDAAHAASAAVPDIAAIKAKLSDVEVINRKVRANVEYLKVSEEQAVLAKRVDVEDANIEHADIEKSRLLASVVYPVDGLQLADDVVSFNGLPFDQASTAEQIRVSVAIGLALNPTLRVLMIRNGNALDADSLRAVSEQIKTADAQLWIEYVTSGDNTGATVVIEEGHVAQ